MPLKQFYKELTTLKTDRLTLREITINDVDDWSICTADPEIYKYWGRTANENEINPKLIFTKVQRKNFGTKKLGWGIAQSDTDRIIGDISIFNVENSRMAKVAYRIAKSYWGKSYTTEALHAVISFCFENTELQRIWSNVAKENIASCRVLEKCGFKQEGLIRQGKFGVEYCDYYIYGILKSDYLANRA